MIHTERVVDDAGQPCPGPCKFWRVTSAAWIRLAFEGLSDPEGNDTAIEGLLIA